VPQRGLTTDELGQIWGAVQDGVPERDVWERLPTSARDQKPLRAAHKVFSFLHRRQIDGNPVMVISPDSGAALEEPVVGVLSVTEFLTEARVRGYYLKEPALLRLFAVHNRLMLLRDVAPGTDSSLTVPPRPFSINSYPQGHEGTLMRVRDHKANMLSVQMPRHLVANFIMNMGRQSNPYANVEEWPDLAFEQFDIHTKSEPIWDDIAKLDGDIADYVTAVTAVVSRVDEHATRTGLDQPYRTGNDSLDPNGPPILLRWFISSLFEYAWDIAEGVVPAQWRSYLEPFGGPHDQVFKLNADPGGKGPQTAAIGPHDTMTQVRETQHELRDELCRSGEPQSLYARYTRLAERAEALRTRLRNLPIERVMEQTCWGCPSKPQA